LNVLPGGGYEQFLPVLPVLPDVLPEEIKAFRDRHDAGLFLGKFQTPYPHEVFDDGTNALFQKLFRDSCHHAIVGIPYQVHIVLDWKVLFELFLESVKGQIGKARGNPPFADRLSEERRRGIVDAVLFDAHGYVKRLETAGIPPKQAEAHAEALLEAMRGGVVTKAELLEVKR